MLALTRATIHENHNSINGNLTENISDLFSLFKKYKSFPYVVHIEGVAGSGKSALCREIVLQWANKNILHNKLLFVLLMCNPENKNLTNIKLLAKTLLSK